MSLPTLSPTTLGDRESQAPRAVESEICPLNLSSTEPGILGPMLVSDPDNPDFEIWFIHGLTGNRRNTWTHHDGETEVFWPEILAKDFPRAKVISYGYDASVVKFNTWKNAPNASIHTYGEELASAIRTQRQESLGAHQSLPLYFIGHSLGGLVVEQALIVCVRASADPAMKKIAAHTQGIFFMGTPHNGSHLARWGSILCRLIPTRLRSSNRQILEALGRNSRVCRALAEKFHEEHQYGKLRHVRVCCFYETVLMPMQRKMVVKEASAVIPGQPKAPITGDHVTMVQFKGDTDPGYKSFKGQLVSWLAQLKIDASRKKKRKTMARRSPTYTTVSGPTFNGTVSGGRIYTNQISSSGYLATGRNGKVMGNTYVTPRKGPRGGGSLDYDLSSDDSVDDLSSDDSDGSQDTAGSDDTAV